MYTLELELRTILVQSLSLQIASSILKPNKVSLIATAVTLVAIDAVNRIALNGSVERKIFHSFLILFVANF